NREVRRAVAAAVSELGKYAELREAIRAAIPQLVELLKHGNSDVRATGAAAISELGRSDFMRSSVACQLLQASDVFRHNDPTIRTTTVNPFISLIAYPDAHDMLLNSQLQSNLTGLLMDDLIQAPGETSALFSQLVILGYDHIAALPVIFHAYANLHDSNQSLQARGASILLAMATHASLRNMIYQVLVVHAMFRLFSPETNSEEINAVIDKMARFGILKLTE
ncbi:hypothetical protein M408DRAFT_28284, partial [Serendipita vermifera MAFF 305830]